MKKSVKEFEGKLVKNQRYFYKFGWRLVFFQEIRNDDSGNRVAVFKDICDQVLTCKTESLGKAIDWTKTYK